MRVLAAVFLLVLALVRPLWAGEVTVAVASNFLTTAEKLARAFHEDTGHMVTLTHGSTGALYAQIVAGAPYDVFLSADAQRPDQLWRDGLAFDKKTYAIGRLVLVSRAEVTQKTAPEAFAGRRVALADPIVAPYGHAAVRAMEKLRVDTGTFTPLLVANVGQAAALFATGNADLAFVAAAQLERLDAPHALPLDGLHPPIRQDAVVLDRARENEAARAFWQFLSSKEARQVIEAAGYDLPR